MSVLLGITLTATWYARGLRSPDAHTAASRIFPRGTVLCVHHENKRVVVRVNDYVEAHGVDLDLSRGAFRKLSTLRRGKIAVKAHPLYGVANDQAQDPCR